MMAWPDVHKEMARLHAVILGKTGVGKSVFLRQCAQTVAQDLTEGLTFIDIHGEAARAVGEWISNPPNGCPGRVRHILYAAGPHGFPIPPFRTADHPPEPFHNADASWASAL